MLLLLFVVVVIYGIKFLLKEKSSILLIIFGKIIADNVI